MSDSQILLHSGQADVFQELFLAKSIRHAVCACSRGWGKSFFAAVCAATAVYELMELPASVPNKNVFIVAPTYSQVTSIYYPYMVMLGMEAIAIKASKDTGEFLFPNGVTLRLVSYEAVDRLRGLGAYFIVNDEVRDWQKGIGLKEAWEGVLKPLISTRWSPKIAKMYGANPGRSLTISTTKGYDYFYDMFNTYEVDEEWASWQFDYESSPYLDPDEVERARRTVDPLTFAREYLARFEDSGNSVFYCFDRKEHVTADLYPLQDWEDAHICIDFNVNLQCSSMFALRGGQMHFLDEFQGHPDTETLAIAIEGRYGRTKDGRKRKIIVYPDPSGNSAKTSSPVGRTDFSILKSFGFEVRAHRKAPPIVDSVQAVNRMLKTQAGDVRLFIHPRCKGLVTSLERTVWVDNNPDTATICKKGNVEHFSDGVRYGTEYLFPVKHSNNIVVTGFNF